jgi:anti-sigma factor RsiW
MAMHDLHTLTMDERFELLSAYLDDEVTSEERQRVEGWLRKDASLKRQYDSLQAMSQQFQSLEIPVQSPSVEQTLNAVMKRVDRRPRLAVLAGLGAASAALVATLASLAGGGGVGTPQIATRSPEIQSPTIQAPSVAVNGTESLAPGTAAPVNPHSLLLALERPPVEIPVVNPTAGQPEF